VNEGLMDDDDLDNHSSVEPIGITVTYEGQ
jgi:hypothetical protein